MEQDKQRRRWLIGAATVTGIVIASDILSKTEAAYATVKDAVNFGDRRKNLNSTNSSSFDTPATALDISQGQLVNIQGTPTPDATVTALNKKKLELDVQQEEYQNNWGWLSTIATPGTVLVGFAGIAATIFQGLRAQRFELINQESIRKEDRNKQLQVQRIELKNREEDRFQTAVANLGKQDTKIGAAVTLLTFLQEGEEYEKYYQQIFNLAVAYLRLPSEDPSKPKPPDPFNQALIKLFVKSYERIRFLKPLNPNLKGEEHHERSKEFDASDIRLDRAYIANAKLHDAWMRGASLRGASLYQSNLSRAYLYKADFSSLREVQEINPPKFPLTRDR